MQDQLLTLVSWFFLALGSFFYVVGALGLFRMPDVFTRMHATSVSDTLGVGFLITGMAIDAGWSLTTARLVIILAILLYSGPIATHALAQAALHAGVKPNLSDDRLKQARRMTATRRAAAVGRNKPTAGASKRAPRKSRTPASRKGRAKPSKR